MKIPRLPGARNIVLSVLFICVSSSLLAQKPTSLPRSTPEAEGVSSQGIIRFLDAAKSGNNELHSFMVLRHGKVVAEGWWNPYAPQLKHTMYSVSKSFTATAVGFAVAEKKLTVDDKVISFFPDRLPDTVSENLRELRIKDLLSMSVGHETDPTGKVAATDDWVRTFLNIPVVYKPGAKFLYNSAATYMLSAIVQKVTGNTVFDYLKPRLFKPLGITGIDWELDPAGINVGGWGLRLKTEDMAKFGQLFLQKGKWEGKQVIPASWIEEASTLKIEQEPDAPQVKKDSSDWLQGYAYQMWRSRNNSYRADGAFGQYILVLPEQDAVIAITSETPNMQNEINLVWSLLLPAFSKDKLPADSRSLKQMKSQIAGLSLTPRRKNNQVRESQISGRTFGVFSSDRTLESVQFNFKNDVCELILKTDSASHTLKFGSGKWEQGVTGKYGPYLVTVARNNRVGLAPFRVAGNYDWIDDNTIELRLRYMESPHTETFRCSFNDDYANLVIINSFTKKEIRHKAVLTKTVDQPARLVIRGDDMGFSHSANEALIKTYKEGILTSIEVIAPSPWFPEAAKYLQQNPQIDVGLHFAVSSEWDNVKWRPLSDAPSLRNDDGYFYPMTFPNKHYPAQSVVENAAALKDIEKELRAQLALALKYIPRLSHISGHMGSISLSGEVKEMSKRVAEEFNLTLVDGGRDNVFNAEYIWFDSRNMSTDQRIDAFITKLDELKPGHTYVYVEHPGMANDELKAIHHIGYENVAQDRQAVTDMLTSEKLKEAIVRRGIRLVSYKELTIMGK